MAHIPVETETHKLVKKMREIEKTNFDGITEKMALFYMKRKHKDLYAEHMKKKK